MVRQPAPQAPRGKAGGQQKPRATKPVPLQPPWHFPWTALVLTILCGACGWYAWQNWAVIAPVLPILGELMGGGDPAMLAQLQGVDPEALVFTGIWFLGLFVAFVVFLILAIVGWVRDW